MDTKPIYLEDSYKKTCTAKILKVKKEGKLTTIVLDQTVFYPVGGGQPSDQGVIEGKKGKLQVEQVVLKGTEIKHIGKLDGKIKVGEKVECKIDWDRRYHNMKVHSAGHILHEAIKHLFPELTPIEAEHGKRAYVKYQGQLDDVSANLVKGYANQIVKDDLDIKTEFVTLEELKNRSPWVPEYLPTNKPLRIMWIGNFPPIPDGGTQVKATSEVDEFEYVQIDNISEDEVVVLYRLSDLRHGPRQVTANNEISFNGGEGTGNILNIKNQAFAQIEDVKSVEELEEIRIDLFGKSGQITKATKNMISLSPEERKKQGMTINEVKKTLEGLIASKKNSLLNSVRSWFDPTMPSVIPNTGHIHMVSRAIDEIAKTFEKIGFQRVRYPEVEWDYFAFGALNFPENHPARDDWETFFVDEKPSHKYGPMLLTPHTSSGQIREMLRVKNPPIRMINIAKTYRRQSDVSHYPMFHQFEGLVIDENISVVNLKGTLDYFAKSFFGEKRITRLRPYHFQFTEPSFEVDISCNVCGGKGCKLCKEGWLELGGAGMVHPNVLKAGGIDSKKYTGFAFGWGVERTYMMKENIAVPDLRLLYSSDVRVLKQL